MNPREQVDRRTALRLIGSAPLTGMAAGGVSNAVARESGAPPDQPHELQPTGADMGSLFPEVERLVSRNEYPYSFLSNRFRSVEEYTKAGREIVLDALGYRPAPVAAAAVVVDRQDMGEFIRKKCSSPLRRTSAYPLTCIFPRGSRAGRQRQGRRQWPLHRPVL